MYGIIVSAGILTALWYAENEWAESGGDIKTYWDAAAWVLCFGIIGARLYHVFDFSEYYFSDPKQILFVWNGGLGILGGLVGGIFGLACYSLKSGTGWRPFLKLLDLTGRTAPLAQFIGRWANYFNQEVFGLPTKLPWGIYIPISKRPEEFIANTTFHPLFLYESLGALGIFILLHTVFYSLRKKLRLVDGEIFLMYLIAYGILRFVLEDLRVSHFFVYGVNAAKVTSFLMAAVPAAFIVYKRLKDVKNARATKPTAQSARSSRT